MMVGALTCPFGTGHMGVTAENVAAENQITREEQDAFALESQTRAAAAIKEGRFASQIVPVEVKVKRETVGFATDEHPKATTAEALAKLRPAFRKDGTRHRRQRQRHQRRRRGGGARHRRGRRERRAEAEGAASSATPSPACRPEVMGIGPIPAVREAAGEDRPHGRRLRRHRVRTRPSPPRRWRSTKGLGLDPAKVNPNGGAIALGHPIGATGAILTIKALYELERTGGRRGLVTMCIGGGQGIALAIERLAA